MKKTNLLVALLGAAAILVTSATSLMAFSFGVGVVGGGTHLEATGTETTRTDTGQNAGATESATEDGQGVFTSAYAQIQVGSGWTLGVDYIFGEVKLDGKSCGIDDLLVDNATNAAGCNKAEAILDNHFTVYAETPGFTPLGLFLKVGYADMDVTTNEELFTGGTYGNASMNGTVGGIGFKHGDPDGGFQTKLEFLYADYDKIEIASSSSSSGTKVSADPETWSVKFGIGYNF